MSGSFESFKSFKRLELDVEQAAGIFLRKRSNVLRVVLRVNRQETLTQRTETAAVIRAEHNIVLTNFMNQKGESRRVRARAVDEEMLEKNIRVFLFALGAFVFPKKTVQ